MKQIPKEDYLVPLSEVVETRAMGVICQSGGNPDSYMFNDNPFWFIP